MPSSSNCTIPAAPSAAAFLLGDSFPYAVIMIAGTFRRLHFRQHLRPAHSRHVDVRQDQQGISDRLCALQRLRCGTCELHDEAPGAHVAAELLAKQVFDVGFVVDKDVGAQLLCPPASACTGMTRGNVMMNSVKEPGSVTTSIIPPCCFTMMSWLIDSPSPVPSPAGFVVKNGWKTFSLISGGMPIPLSRMRISILSPRFRVTALSFGSKPLPATAARWFAA